MDQMWNPDIPVSMREELARDKEEAFTLYLDFIVDGTASMYTVYPAVYYAATHFLDGLSRYEIVPKLGITVIRNEAEGEKTEVITFDGQDPYTLDSTLFLKKLKGIELYGGGNDGRESVHSAIWTSLQKFPSSGRNKAIFVFSDAYGSNDMRDFCDIPIGQAIFFTTDSLNDEDYIFSFIRPDGEYDEEASPMYIHIEKLLKPMSTKMLDDIVKPLKDLLKGVSIGA